MKVPFGWQTFTPKYGAGEVTVEIHPMTTAQMMAAMPKLETQEDGERVFFSLVALQQQAAEVLPACARNLAGLDGDEGPVSLEQVCQYPMFMTLATEILTAILHLSRIGEGDQGNSKVPAPAGGTDAPQAE